MNPILFPSPYNDSGIIKDMVGYQNGFLIGQKGCVLSVSVWNFTKKTQWKHHYHLKKENPGIGIHLKDIHWFAHILNPISVTLTMFHDRQTLPDTLHEEIGFEKRKEKIPWQPTFDWDAEFHPTEKHEKQSVQFFKELYFQHFSKYDFLFVDSVSLLFLYLLRYDIRFNELCSHSIIIKKVNNCGKILNLQKETIPWKSSSLCQNYHSYGQVVNAPIIYDFNNEDVWNMIEKIWYKNDTMTELLNTGRPLATTYLMGVGNWTIEDNEGYMKSSYNEEDQVITTTCYRPKIKTYMIKMKNPQFFHSEILEESWFSGGKIVRFKTPLLEEKYEYQSKRKRKNRKKNQVKRITVERYVYKDNDPLYDYYTERNIDNQIIKLRFRDSNGDVFQYYNYTMNNPYGYIGWGNTELIRCYSLKPFITFEMIAEIINDRPIMKNLINSPTLYFQCSFDMKKITMWGDARYVECNRLILK